MQAKIRSQALIRLASKILRGFKTPEDMQFPGVRFDAPEGEWRGGYGVPKDDNIPDFVKKDNDGWDYVAQSKDE